MPARSRKKQGRLGTGRRDWLWVLAFVVVAAAVAFLALVAFAGSGSREVVAGVECERGERVEYHVHSRLAVFVEGEEVTIPGDIGRERGCIYWLHTHDGQAGLIHVEAPSNEGFTLGQFFQIWGQPLSSTQLLDRTTDASHEIRSTVGTQQYEGDPATIPLSDQVFIRLEYGPPFQGESP
jgi:hypothetical protein